MDPAAKRRAAFAEPPHLQDPSGNVVAWLTDPPGSLLQFVRPAAATLQLGEWVVGPARKYLLARFPEGPLALVLDLTLMTSRDPAVRSLLVESGKEMKSRIAQTVIIPPQDMGAVYLASLRASVSLVAMFGVRVSIQKSLPFALASLGLKAGVP